MAWLDNLENEDLRFNSRSWLTLTKEPFEAFSSSPATRTRECGMVDARLLEEKP